MFIASGMVQENWLKVALSAMALGLGPISYGLIAAGSRLKKVSLCLAGVGVIFAPL